MRLQIVKRNLLDMPQQYVIAHNIDAGETAMGAGVALALCNHFQELREKCKTYAKEHNHQVGLTYRHVAPSGQVIYNMFTKANVWRNAYRGMTPDEYYGNQRKCLEHLKEQMLQNNEYLLAIPKIACGLDRCEWFKIEEIIKDVFKETNVNITVCVI